MQRNEEKLDFGFSVTYYCPILEFPPPNSLYDRIDQKHRKDINYNFILFKTYFENLKM